MNRRSTKRLCALLFGCALASFTFTSPAQAIILDLGFGLGYLPDSSYYSKFSAPEDQKATVGMYLMGDIFADGSGISTHPVKGTQPFQFKSPFTHYTGFPINSSAVSVESNPVTSPPYAKLTTDHLISGVDEINNFGLELLNGQSLDFALDATATTTAFHSLVKNLNVGFAGSLTSLHFQQTGGGIGGWIDGDMTATIQFQPNFLGGFVYDPPVTRTFTIPTSLMGNWDVDPPFGFQRKLSLDGTLNIAIPISLATNFNSVITDFVSLTMSSTVELQASMFLEIAYHLEQTFYPTPEPGSIVLLGIGLTAVSLYGLGRRTARSKGP